MKKTLACLLLVVSVFSLSARENPLAMGFQVGLAATGAVLDVELGPLSLNAGFNYPVLYTYMAATSNIDPKDVFLKVATFTLDISRAFPLGRGFDFKLGLGSIVLTDFGPVFGGLAGVVLKGEYWAPGKNHGMFLNINLPLILYGVLLDYTEDGTSSDVHFNPLYPLLGLLTTSVGLLFSF